MRFNVGATGLGRAIDPSCDDDDVSGGGRGAGGASALPTRSNAPTDSSPPPLPFSPPQLKEGSEVEVPLWMVPALAARGMVTVKLPRFYGERCGEGGVPLPLKSSLGKFAW